MVFDTVSPKLERGDYLAVFPAGFYILGVITFTLSGLFSWDLASILSSINDGSTKITTPILTLLASLAFLAILFGSYAIGSLVRTFRVSTTDKLLRPKFQCSWPPLVFVAEFPFPKVLNGVLRKLNAAAVINGMDDYEMPTFPPLPQTGKITTSIFNYWKDTLCVGAPTAYAFAQSLEAKARFFVGMFWAGAIGVVGAIVTICIAPAAWTTLGIWLCCTSIVISGLFGWRLRVVRRQEAIGVFSAYLAYLKSK